MAAQPIAIDDLLSFLCGSLTVPLDGSRVFEIGGADRVSYAEIMRAYARMRGRRLLMIPVPVLTPFLSSLWLGLVTPLYARIGRTLIESIVHSTVVRDTSAATAFGIRPRGMESALREALADEEREIASTRWSSALSSGAGIRTWAGVRFGSRLVDSRTIRVDVPVPAAFTPIRRIGGRTGWYAWNVLWRLRGALDLLAGGVGLRRGRPLEDDLRVGDPLDFWRVEAYEPDHLLRLTAEMRLPGRAWLEFEVTGEQTGSTIRQTAVFDPIGPAGLLYWYAVYPLHMLVFRGMLRGIAARAGQARGQQNIREPRRSG
jgi:hypothetical protein